MAERSLSLDRAAELLRSFRGLPVTVWGDLMLDAYLEGSVERISPEAPVPVVVKRSLGHRLGGSSNVAHNLAALGAKPRLSGVVGTDAAADVFRDLASSDGISVEAVVGDSAVPTSVKTRVIAGSQQLLRIDEEVRRDVAGDVADRMLATLRAPLESSAAVIVSDYGKGVIHPGTWKRFAALREGGSTPCVCDPKKRNYGLYVGVDAMTHNHHEAGEDAGLPCLSDEETTLTGRALLAKYGMERTLITRGPRGMAICRKDRETDFLPTFARQVFDVSGAGDTVIAVFTCALAVGADWVEAATLANHAAGVVVSKFGTAVASPEEILEDIRQHADG